MADSSTSSKTTRLRLPIPGWGLLARRRPPEGAAPGTLVLAPSSEPTRVRITAYDPHEIAERENVELDDIRSPHDGSVVTWIDIAGLSDQATLEHVAREFDIHRVALADIVNVPQRARVEHYGGHILVIARWLWPLEGQGFDAEQISFVLGPGYLVSFQEKPADTFAKIRQRLVANTGVLRTLGADYLLYALIDATVDTYYPVIEDIGERLERLEDEISGRHPPADALARLHAQRRELLRLSRAARWHRDLIADLLRADRTEISDPARVYFRDARDHALELLESAAAYGAIADSLMELHLSLANTRLNEVMKVLTVVSATFIPLTLVASIYGMNFQHMPELAAPLGYPIVLAVMLTMATALLVYFRRLGWLGGRRDGGDA